MGDAMRLTVRSIVAAGLLLAASAASAQRYDPAYPVCMEQYGADGSVIDCFFTSIEQCKGSVGGTAGLCFNNPYYKPPPAESAPVAEPVPAPAPTAVKKKKKAAASTQPLPTAPAAR
jgi:hypothetical protein